MERSYTLQSIKILSWLSLFFVIGSIAFLIIFLFLKGGSSLGLSLFFGDTNILDAILGLRPVWGGIWPALIGTFALVVLTLSIATIPGIGCGIYLAEYASPKIKRIGGSMVDMLAGTPSIVMGLFGFILILILRRSFMPSANTCLLLAALCLALLVLPVIIVTTKEAIEAVPHEIRIASISLGLSRYQTVRQILVPASSQGILSGLVLATGRAAEDTAVIMLTGVVANAGLPAGLFAKFEALPFHVFYIAAEYQNEDQLTNGFGTAIVLLSISFLILIIARILEQRFKSKWKGSV